MSRYIDVDMYIEYLTELKQSAKRHCKLYEALQLQYIIDQIKCFPTAKAQEVSHGNWFDNGSLSCRCSECGCKSNRESNFCPHCGAKMDKE